MKKILLVGGDSFTDKFYQRNAPGTITWPEIIAKKLDMRLVCVARSGAGNEQIYSSIQDYMCEVNPEDIGLILAGWSESQRMDFELVNMVDTAYEYKKLSEGMSEFDIYETYRSKNWTSAIKSPRGDMYSHIRKSVRNFYNLQMLCENNNIKYKQFQMINLFKEQLDEFNKTEETYTFARNNAISYLKNSPQFNHINKEHFIGWPIYDEGNGFVIADVTVHFDRMDENDKAKVKKANLKDNFKSASKKYIIDSFDTHPNQAGHELIAEFVYGFL